MPSALSIARLRAAVGGFSRGYWTFYAAAFCMDIGFGLFFFLFNLYLTDLHFDESVIGRAMACLTLGNVAATIPATILVRRYGLRPLLLITFTVLPLLCVMRTTILWLPAQYGLAFLTGAALCGWPICFSPAIAALTTTKNRATGFSIAFATGIGLGSLAGIAGGFLPRFFQSALPHATLIDGIRIVLQMACVLTFLGVLPLLRLSFPRNPEPREPASPKKRIRIFHPFLLRFLPPFVLWNVVTGSFPIFGAIYLQKSIGIPLTSLGAVFSGSQLLQFCAVLLAPFLFRRIGLTRAIAAAQVTTAIFLILIAITRFAPFAVSFYLLYFAAQFMCSPGIYSLLMDSVPEEERSTASATQNLSGALCQAATQAVTGISIVAFGYRPVLFANAGAALIAALLFLGLKIQNSTAAEGPGYETFPSQPDLNIEKAL
ncbi:MFS transporter [Terracidiphilus gabretensis]|uniref:MFS transporter n=1 Tax=Terracidiphilus gabretensis TaxID=1577687 RepID=UPI00071BB3F0|nr:MFS transporter [Terracidiphilus gabretensis]